MTCNDVSQLLDPFLDTELPPPMLLAVARHAGTCTACDAAIRDLTELRELVARSNIAAVDGLDLRGVWPAVEAGLDRHDAAQARARRLRSLPAWGAMVAMAASLLVWIGYTPERQPTRPSAVVASAAPAGLKQTVNHTYIDRLKTARPVEVRREPKGGTTVIWVNYTEDVGR